MPDLGIIGGLWREVWGVHLLMRCRRLWIVSHGRIQRRERRIEMRVRVKFLQGEVGALVWRLGRRGKLVLVPIMIRLVLVLGRGRYIEYIMGSWGPVRVIVVAISGPSRYRRLGGAFVRGGVGGGRVGDQRSQFVGEIHARGRGSVAAVLSEWIGHELGHVELGVDVEIVGRARGIVRGGGGGEVETFLTHWGFIA